MSNHPSNQSSLSADFSMDSSYPDSFNSLPSYLQSPADGDEPDQFPQRNDSVMSSLAFGIGVSGRSDDDDDDQRDYDHLARAQGGAGGGGGVDDRTSSRTEGDYSAITLNANNISSYNHSYIKALSEGSDALEQESKDQIIPLASGSGHSITPTNSVIQELRQRNQKMSNMAKMKSVAEVMNAGKRSNAIDLETGREGGHRSQCAIIREEYERYPQSRRSRGLKKVIKWITKPFRPKKPSRDQRAKTKKQRFRDGNKISRRTVSIPSGDDTQYQIFSIDESLGGKGMQGINKSRSDKHKLLAMLSPEKLVTSYLFWAFRSSFIAVLISAALWFGLITFAFASVLFGLASYAPNCLYIAGKDFDGQFMDAYALSWTTFATVGYGAVFPGTTATTEDVNKCWAITILTTVEAFVGILFASFWGAIFLSKVTRVSSSAQVMFSDPVLIRFGQGVKGNHNPEEESESSDSELEGATDATSYPCPVLEFRLINKMHSQRKGEIIDASLNMVASVDFSQITREVGATPQMNNKKKKGKKGKGRKTSGFGSYRDIGEAKGRPSENDLFKMKQFVRKILIQSERPEEHNDPKIASRREFAKLYVESQDHPFFKRVWVAKHVLDQDSPLLINDAKEMIRMNGGRWPKELNNASAVRACVKFDQILVSLSGTSNADANTVYAQKIYDFSNVVVGYRFCNILYREVDGSLGVDVNLLNDVVEQAGGGGEELDERMRFSFRQSKVDILIL